MKQAILLLLTVAITSTTFAQKSKRVIKKLGSDPVFFIDSVNVEKEALGAYNPEQIASVTVYKERTAMELLGEDGKDGAVYIETKVFAKKRYWNYFSSKSNEYLQVVPTPESDSSVQYILNGKVAKENYEGNLSSIDDKVFKSIKVIGKQELEKLFGPTDKSFGVLIESQVPYNLYKGREKF